MNTRSFIATLGAIVIAPWNAIMRQRKPILKQVFPVTMEEMPGLICKNIYAEGQYEIVRGYDDWKDEWQGKRFDNSRRNKWWAKAADGTTVLLYTGSRFNDKETLFFKKLA